MTSLNRYSLLAILALIPLVYVGFMHVQAAATPVHAAIAAPLAPGATIAAQPGRADSENTFVVESIQARAVRLLSRSLDMNMGTTAYMASPLPQGAWQVINVEVPMIGRWGIEVQARRGGVWVTVGTVAYDVPFSGTMQLIHPGQGTRR